MREGEKGEKGKFRGKKKSSMNLNLQVNQPTLPVLISETKKKKEGGGKKAENVLRWGLIDGATDKVERLAGKKN